MGSVSGTTQSNACADTSCDWSPSLPVALLQRSSGGRDIYGRGHTHIRLLRLAIHKALASVKINVSCNDQLLDHFREFRVGVLSGFLGGRHKLL